MHYVDLFGWIAGLLTLAAYSMTTMLPLRIAAMGSNLFFILFGALGGIWPTLVLHVILLPFNAYRLWQILRTRREIEATLSDDGLPRGIVDLLSPQRVAAGTVLFRRGEAADCIYYLQSGRLLLEEYGSHIEPGEFFGEIAFLIPRRTRLLTARCETECRIARLSEAEFTRLHYENPAFGVHMMKLLATRLVQTYDVVMAGPKEPPPEALGKSAPKT